MFLCPAVGLSHGQVEGQGDPRTALEAARAFREAGATWMQVIDLDAARGGPNQWPQLARLLDGSLRIQFGGGIRSMTQVQQLLDLGVERVIVGTQAVRNPLWARELALIFPGRIVLALDADQGDLLVAGRTEASGLDAVATAAALDDAGLAAFLYSDVGGPPRPEMVARIRLAAPTTPLFVAGASTLEQLEGLRESGAAGAVLDHGALILQEALRRYPEPLPLRVLRAREAAGPGGVEPGRPDGWDGPDGAEGPEGPDLEEDLEE